MKPYKALQGYDNREKLYRVERNVAATVKATAKCEAIQGLPSQQQPAASATATATASLRATGSRGLTRFYKDLGGAGKGWPLLKQQKE